tara:strand:+ start:725 stop:1108 length:384 start_codon:yes stop_codon:yes gene_type:complete
MNFLFLIVVLSLFFSGNAFSKTTSLNCKLEKSNDTFLVLLDHRNGKATWNDKVFNAVFSATTVTFIPAQMGSIGKDVLKMEYSLNRINLEVVKTVTLTRTVNIYEIDEVISLERGACEIGKKIETKF